MCAAAITVLFFPLVEARQVFINMITCTRPDKPSFETEHEAAGYIVATPSVAAAQQRPKKVDSLDSSTSSGDDRELSRHQPWSRPEGDEGLHDEGLQ